MVTTTQTAEERPGEGNTESAVWALLALVIGFFGAAVVSFEEAASLGTKTGLGLVALSPFVLLLRVRAPKGTRPLAGCVSSGWVLLLAGGVSRLVRADEDPVDPFAVASVVVEPLGAIAVLIALRASGAFGALGLFVRISLGLVVGGGVLTLALALEQPVPALRIGAVLGSGFLIPQVLHDWALVRWARRENRWPSARRAMGAVGLPFVLVALAGRLVSAPMVLYYQPKEEVFWAGVASASLLALLGLRAYAGAVSRLAATVIIAACTLYGVGLAVLVTGKRYVPQPADGKAAARRDHAGSRYLATTVLTSPDGKQTFTLALGPAPSIATTSPVPKLR